MTRAREVGDAFVAARRLLVLAGAVAGLWLVSWLTSGSAEAATVQTRALPDVIGVVVEAVTPAEPRETADVVRSPKRAAGPEGRAAAHGARSSAAEVGAPGVAGAVPGAARAAAAVAGSVSRGVLTPADSRAAHPESPTSSPPAAKTPAFPAADRAGAAADRAGAAADRAGAAADRAGAAADRAAAAADRAAAAA
ncbi:hypothetical protein, partial [Amycolatopsis sp. MtRt-6]|uniref:hypothetical protein n=1 Tax=Amycolatopsis sp. MtRt-6 TaxID=2792782 RepID=UPI0035AC19FA